MRNEGTPTMYPDLPALIARKKEGEDTQDDSATVKALLRLLFATFPCEADEVAAEDWIA